MLRLNNSSLLISGPNSKDDRDVFSLRTSKCLECFPTCQAASPGITLILIAMASSQSMLPASRKAPSSSNCKDSGFGSCRSQILPKASRNSEAFIVFWVLRPDRMMVAVWESLPSSNQEMPRTCSREGFPFHPYEGCATRTYQR